MTAEDLAIAAGCYIFCGVIIGIVSPFFLDAAPWCPEGGKPALAFTFGALWPLSLIVGVGYALWRSGVGYALWLAGRTLGRSFAVLWLAWRPARASVPRATARERAS